MFFGIKAISLRQYMDVCCFDILKQDGLGYSILPPQNILLLESGEFKARQTAIWAGRMAKEMGLPARFWMGDDLRLQWQTEPEKGVVEVPMLQNPHLLQNIHSYNNSGEAKAKADAERASREIMPE